ncbi:hypothetical protein N177_3457 [Lutibaculum baratangense AMV1]|uniref:Uncharacterized protein n=1 Tax=Lutibaculum baratangense AMV1 TaxID=631454 RepID=V4RDG1_9HYPH|nr:hypothetical protein N177_3457 [Lutibaculum baratangense AMV1]
MSTVAEVQTLGRPRGEAILSPQAHLFARDGTCTLKMRFFAERSGTPG